ncbi:MAG TPA: P-II family nitrogen regulator [Bacteroidales bacterium]|nr:P-II family nitrogen regulator [Bacteroidales bacterium]
MKMIISIIRMAKMNETKKALLDVGLSSFMASGEVQGRGKGLGVGPTFEKNKQNPDYVHVEHKLKTKRMITMYVTDDKVDLAVQTIIKVNQTGNSGDGKIFLLPATDAVQIRTGDSGDKVLD